MARGAGAGLIVLLGCEGLLLAAAVATVLPAVREGIEGAEERAVARVERFAAAVEPAFALARGWWAGGPHAPVLADRTPPEPPPEPQVAAAPVPSEVTGSIAVQPSEPPRAIRPPAAGIALAPVEPRTPLLRPFAPPPRPVEAARPAPQAVPEPSRDEGEASRPSGPPPPPERTVTPSFSPPPAPPRTLAAMLDKPAAGDVAALQARLIDLGLLRGAADDVAGEATMTALLRYLDRHRLHPGLAASAVIAHMDRVIDGGPAPSMPTEVFLIGRDFAADLRGELTRTDLRAARAAISHALSSLERGQAHAALARRGGASFVVTPVSGDRFDRCRRFTLTIHAAGREQTGRGIRACRIGPNWALSDG